MGVAIPVADGDHKSNVVERGSAGSELASPCSGQACLARVVPHSDARMTRIPEGAVLEG